MALLTWNGFTCIICNALLAMLYLHNMRCFTCTNMDGFTCMICNALLAKLWFLCACALCCTCMICIALLDLRCLTRAIFSALLIRCAMLYLLYMACNDARAQYVMLFLHEYGWLYFHEMALLAWYVMFYLHDDIVCSSLSHLDVDYARSSFISLG